MTLKLHPVPLTLPYAKGTFLIQITSQHGYDSPYSISQYRQSDYSS